MPKQLSIISLQPHFRHDAVRRDAGMGDVQAGDLLCQGGIQAGAPGDFIGAPAFLRFPDHQLDLLPDIAAVDLHRGFLRGMRDLDLLTGESVFIDL